MSPAGASIKSVKCALSSCGNPVRMDYPSFPYCRHHSALKTSSSQFSPELYQGGMESVRETLYNPKKSSIPAGALRIDTVSSTTGIDKDTVRDINHAYLQSTRGKGNIRTLAKKAFDSRDDIIDMMISLLMGKFAGKISKCKAQSGSITVPGGKVKKIPHDHHIIVVEEDNEPTLVIDPVPISQLNDVIDGDVREKYPNWNDKIVEGVDMCYLYEYARYSNSQYARFVVSEEDGSETVIWDNNDLLNDDNSDTNMQREIIKRHGMQNFTPPRFQVSPKLDAVDSKKDKLDELFD